MKEKYSMREKLYFMAGALGMTFAALLFVASKEGITIEEIQDYIENARTEQVDPTATPGLSYALEATAAPGFAYPTETPTLTSTMTISTGPTETPLPTSSPTPPPTATATPFPSSILAQTLRSEAVIRSLHGDRRQYEVPVSQTILGFSVGYRHTKAIVEGNIEATIDLTQTSDDEFREVIQPDGSTKVFVEIPGARLGRPSLDPTRTLLQDLESGFFIPAELTAEQLVAIQNQFAAELIRGACDNDLLEEVALFAEQYLEDLLESQPDSIVGSADFEVEVGPSDPNECPSEEIP